MNNTICAPEDKPSMFTVLDETNTARVTCSDPRPNTYHTQSFDAPTDVRSIANIIAWYARQRQMPLAMVEVSIVYPAGRAQA